MDLKRNKVRTGFEWFKTDYGRAMTQAIIHRPLTAEARVRARASPRGICGGQNGTGTGLSPSSSVLPSQYNSSWLSNLIYHLEDEQ
jgi:hypothetical protein